MLFRAAQRITTRVTSRMQQLYLSPQVLRSASTSGASTERARRVKVSHILLPADSEALLVDLESRLAGGADFSDLAREHSTCRSSGKKGGELGWLSRGTYYPDFESVAFAAPVGVVTRAVTGRGAHLLRVSAERFESPVAQMTVQELAELLSNETLCEEVQFVDVREQSEMDTASLPNFRLFPLSLSDDWGPHITTMLNPDMETVVLCHHGVRSMQMATFLCNNGFQDVKNVSGGIDAYSRGVDRNVPQY